MSNGLELIDILGIICSIVGAILFIYAITVEFKIINRLKQVKKPNKWRLATYLTIFFLLGYAINILCILLGWVEVQQIFGALVFAMGAVFVLLVISISHKTYTIIFEEAEKGDR